VLAASLLAGAAQAEGSRGHSWPHQAGAETVVGRFAPPPGFARVAAPPDGFAAWLRRLPLKPAGAPVLLFDGRAKPNQAIHAAVIDIDVGARDLQQCADAVMRLRAEYLYAGGPAERARIAFNFTSGDRIGWSRWSGGARPVVTNNRVRWAHVAPRGEDRANFAAYLQTIFTYAGSHSLEREMASVAVGSVQGGDVFIQGGFPGHAVIVLDVAAHRDGRRAMLLAQSFMPAQSIHVLKNPAGGVWYAADETAPLVTPEWTFPAGSLRRFREGAQ
jgi:hypothetical protein